MSLEKRIVFSVTKGTHVRKDDGAAPVVFFLLVENFFEEILETSGELGYHSLDEQLSSLTDFFVVFFKH